VSKIVEDSKNTRESINAKNTKNIIGNITKNIINVHINIWKNIITKWRKIWWKDIWEWENTEECLSLKRNARNILRKDAIENANMLNILWENAREDIIAREKFIEKNTVGSTKNAKDIIIGFTIGNIT